MIIAFDPEISLLRIYFEEKIKRRKKVNKLGRVKKTQNKEIYTLIIIYMFKGYGTKDK